MSINPGFELPFGIQPTNPVPVDAWSGPFTAASLTGAVVEANSQIPSAVRFQSMEVRLIVGGESYKYWYSGGTGDGDLVSFQPGATGIDSLTDVATSLKINNDLLAWNSATNKWINKGVGLSAGNFIILGSGGTAGTGKLPAVDGSQLLEVNARYLDGKLREQITDGGVF